VDDVAAAIADPVRRDILVMLREQGLPAGQIADRFHDQPARRQPTPTGAARRRLGPQITASVRDLDAVGVVPRPDADLGHPHHRRRGSERAPADGLDHLGRYLLLERHGHAASVCVGSAS